MLVSWSMDRTVRVWRPRRDGGGYEGGECEVLPVPSSGWLSIPGVSDPIHLSLPEDDAFMLSFIDAG